MNTTRPANPLLISWINDQRSRRTRSTEVDGVEMEMWVGVGWRDLRGAEVARQDQLNVALRGLGM